MRSGVERRDMMVIVCPLPSAHDAGDRLNTLAPKLILTPLLVASTSLVGRRWGGALSGWLVALPLTSGPIVLFIALEQGASVAQQAAGGSLIGATAQVAFAAAYTVVARRFGWMPSLAIAVAAFIAVALAVPPLPPVASYVLLVSVVATFLAGFGHQRGNLDDAAPTPAWDIAARVVVATVLVVAISALAPIVGGRASGILATFPVYAAVLATFAHVTRGPPEAGAVLRGLATGLLGFGAFFLALSLLLGTVGIATSFLAALAIGCVVQAATLPLVRMTPRR
jgi:hypothetical protein